MTNQPEPPPGLLTFEQFEPLVGQPFDLPIGDERFVLTLTEASLLPRHNPEIHWRPPFRLTFTCPDQRILPQQMYRIEHAALTDAELFLVAVAGDADGITYEAIFN